VIDDRCIVPHEQSVSYFMPSASYSQSDDNEIRLSLDQHG
jgi:hypothetical protein